MKENRRELRLKQRELQKNKEIENITDNNSNLTLSLENFDIDKNTKINLKILFLKKFINLFRHFH